MKYLGGKQRIGKHIAAYLQKFIETNIKFIKTNESPKIKYVEPFCGSLGVLKHMTDYDVVANDYHSDLIEMWKTVQKGELDYPESVSEDEYNAAKEMKSPSAMKAFIGFGMSFGGRYFGAYAHKYLGNKKEDFCKEMRNSLERIRPKIKNVQFMNKDYRDLKPDGCFIYCDPPYRETKYPIKYRRGTKDYDVFDSEEFWNIIRKWSKNNIVIVSETTAPSDFKEIWTSDQVRSASRSKNTPKTNAVEKLFIIRDHIQLAL